MVSSRATASPTIPPPITAAARAFLVIQRPPAVRSPSRDLLELSVLCGPGAASRAIIPQTQKPHRKPPVSAVRQAGDRGAGKRETPPARPAGPSDCELPGAEAKRVSLQRAWPAGPLRRRAQGPYRG